MNLTKKSVTAAFFLTLLLGPLGLLYSSIVGAIILGVIAVLTAPSIIGPIICWVISIIVGMYSANKHNEGVDLAMSALKRQ